MRYSKFFGKTTKDELKHTKFMSHYYLQKGGFIAESVAGRYFFLPLGWRVHEKIRQIIKEEMDAAGALEMMSPVLHPLELWEETNRTSSAGFELMKVADRRGANFALGGTAEEMFVDVVRNFQLSYRDLPFNLYQFSTKFRDELRARGGLLRVREFVMKDAYSFHVDEADFQEEYQKMADTYRRIFRRLDLETVMVEADNGYIGGEYCHEFQVESALGEGRFFAAADGSYLAHEDVAQFFKEDKNSQDDEQPYQQVPAVRGTTMTDGAELHQLPLWQQLKNVLYKNEQGEFILAVIRGDFDVNEVKLLHLTKSHQLTAATEEEIRELGSEPGFIFAGGLEDKVTVVVDDSIHTIKNAYTGANQKHLDSLNVNYPRDFTAHLEGDIAMAAAGFLTQDSHQPLEEKFGIEVANIFQLGHHYSRLMHHATFTDQNGDQVPFYMGCYGIGLGRTMAAIAEKHHDEHGIIWPTAVAPFAVHLITLGGDQAMAEKLYQRLTEAGVEVLWDDRDETAGVKFATADLIGNPVRLVISSRTGDQIEWKERSASNSELLTPAAVLAKLTK